MNSIRLSKRQFLVTAAAATAAACAWEPLFAAAGAPATKRTRLNLNGAWEVAKEGDAEWLPATVPGCVHTDLLAASRIPDPYFRDNEKTVQWVGETNWVYRRRFEVPQEVLDRQRVVLRCQGLDTLAVVKLNGSEIGRANNMFRTWEYDRKIRAQSRLQPARNLFLLSAGVHEGAPGQARSL